MRATVTQIGNSIGVILPKEVVAKLKVKKGDSVFLQETPTGYQLQAYDPAFGEVMEAAEDVMHRYRNTLRKLAE